MTMAPTGMAAYNLGLKMIADVKCQNYHPIHSSVKPRVMTSQSSTSVNFPKIDLNKLKTVKHS